jgi:hypothetical protein
MQQPITDVESESKPSTGDVDTLCRRIKATIDKGNKYKEQIEHARKKANDFFISAGIQIKELKGQCADEKEWLSLLKKHCAIGRSRAFELMKVANGGTTLEELRAEKADQVRRTRERAAAADSPLQAECSGQTQLALACIRNLTSTLNSCSRSIAGLTGRISALPDTEIDAFVAAIRTVSNSADAFLAAIPTSPSIDADDPAATAEARKQLYAEDDGSIPPFLRRDAGARQ